MGKPERQDGVDQTALFEDGAYLGGGNFLVSAIMLLKRQKKDLQAEVQRLKERLQTLEQQNAAFIDVSAQRLLNRTISKSN